MCGDRKDVGDEEIQVYELQQIHIVNQLRCKVANSVDRSVVWSTSSVWTESSMECVYSSVHLDTLTVHSHRFLPTNLLIWDYGRSNTKESRVSLLFMLRNY